MKCLLFSCLLFIPFAAYCQISDTGTVPRFSLASNRIVFTGIDSTNILTKEQLFHNAEEWYSRNYQSNDNTLTIDNIIDGKLSGTGIIHATKKEKQINAGDVFFTIDIIVANGRYSYTVYNIYSLEPAGRFYYSDMYNEELYPDVKPKWEKPYRHIMLSNMNGRISAMIIAMKGYMDKR